jgi:hypothetical protein
MYKKRYDAHTKKQVAALRAQGKTYGDIQKLFPIPRSTLSAWLGKKYAHIFTREAQLAHLAQIRPLSTIKVRRMRVEKYARASEKASAVAHTLTLTNTGIQQALLSMLHWAEGTKKDGVGLRFANTDPRMMHLYLSLLRNCFAIDETRLRIRLHVHYYHEKRETVRFWSSLLRIPESQFWKTYVKKRSTQKRFRKNSRGICFLYYPGDLIRKELLETAYEICAILPTRNLP